MADALGTPGPPAGPGVVSALDHRLDHGGLLALTGTGMDVRTGVLHGPGTTALVTGTAATGTMTVSVAPHHWVTSRSVADGVYLGAVEAATTVNIAAAPGANSRIDVVYVKQNDQYSTVSADASSAMVVDKVTGTAAVSPTKPPLPVGALELATVTVAAGATSTNGAGVTITNTARQTVARGAAIPVRNQAERDAYNPIAYPGLRVIRLDLPGYPEERWLSGTTWDNLSYPGPWIPLTILSGAAYTGWPVPAVRRLSAHQCQLRGLVENPGHAVVLAQVPADMRPEDNLTYAVPVGDGAGFCQINLYGDGNIVAQGSIRTRVALHQIYTSPVA